MKTQILLSLFIATMVFSCSNDKLSGESSLEESINLQEKALLTPLTNDIFTKLNKESSKSSNAKAVTRTIKINRSAGFFDFVFPSTECAPFIQVLIIGKGNATFLGNFDVLNKYCFDGEQPVGPIYGFLTAANGDEIFTQMIGAIEVPAPEISFFDYVILGGTGRFEGASGTIQMYGTIDRVNFVFNLEGEGEITF
jgi:hypothetical protein